VVQYWLSHAKVSLEGMDTLHRETIERGRPWWLLKLRQMGDSKSLNDWALLVGKRDFCPALAALVGPVQNFFLLTVHYHSPDCRKPYG